MGHGDAILLRWLPADGTPANILIDGGPRTAQGLRLLEGLADVAEALDLVVLTHTDADHVDGLLQYAQSPGRLPIKEYWGPCLPAFKRFSWLFPDRVKRGLDQAEQLESVLGAETRQLYPVESASWRSADGGLTVKVISPAARLVERLLVADDGIDLFLATPTPLGWLLEPGGEAPIEDIHADLRASLRSGFLDRGIARVASTPTEVGTDQVASIRASAEHPEFFGNHVLNDTSIVLLVEARIGRTVKRLLFTGDLENFTYLAARYPLGLQCDVVKAPHHGSWSYLEKSGTALDEVWQWLRPKAVLVSGKGKHGLPRAEFRDAVLRWGSTLFCTCRRSKEIVVGENPAGSCHEQFGCGKRDQESVTLEIGETGLVSDGVACASGATAGIMPIVQVRQHVIDPSALLDRFTTSELDDHVRWIERTLRDLHRERGRIRIDHDPELGGISSELLGRQAGMEGRHPVAPNIDLILDRAVAKGLIWSRAERWRRGERQAYILPAQKDWAAMFAWIEGYAALQLEVRNERAADTATELLTAADTSFLSGRAAAKFGFPREMFDDVLWIQLAARLKRDRRFHIRRGGGSKSMNLVIRPSGSDDEAYNAILERLPGGLLGFGQALCRADTYRDSGIEWPYELADILAPPQKESKLQLSDLISLFHGSGSREIEHWLPKDFYARYGTRIHDDREVTSLLAAWAFLNTEPLAGPTQDR